MVTNSKEEEVGLYVHRVEVSTYISAVSIQATRHILRRKRACKNFVNETQVMRGSNYQDPLLILFLEVFALQTAQRSQTSISSPSFAMRSFLSPSLVSSIFSNS